MPETRPDMPTVATLVLLLAHVPPVDVVVRGDVLPAHMLNVPVMDAGTVFTVTVWARPHPLLSM